MPNPPTLRLQLLDVQERPLRQPADIMLRHQTTGRLKVVRAAAARVITIRDLQGAPSSIYRVQVDPPAYLASGAFVSLAASGATTLALTFAVDPRKVLQVGFTPYGSLSDDARRILEATDAALGFDGLSGPALYEALDDIRRAGFLNIMAKASATALTNERLVSHYIQRVLELRGDRFYAIVTKELREETKNSAQAGLFEPAPGLLHHPPPGFDRAGSFKTPDGYGNLQLTFFTNGTDWMADIDIDDANGLAHLFQVLRNEITGRPTHPYDIHQILIRHQKLHPGYELRV